MNYHKKYLKYKNKYLELKLKQTGGDVPYILKPDEINLFKNHNYFNYFTNNDDDNKKITDKIKHMESYLNPIHGGFLYGSGYITNNYHLRNTNIIERDAVANSQQNRTNNEYVHLINTNQSKIIRKICIFIPNIILPTNNITNFIKPKDIGRLIAIKYIFMMESTLTPNDRFFLKKNKKSIEFNVTVHNEHRELLTNYMLYSTPLNIINIQDNDKIIFHLLLYFLWWISNNNEGIKNYYIGINEVFTIVNNYPYNNNTPRNYLINNLFVENLNFNYPSYEDTVIQIIQDQFKIINFHKARHFCPNDNIINTYSDCGETTLRNFINLLCYNNGIFDINILINLGAITPVINYYNTFNTFDKQMNENLMDNITNLNSRDAWSKLIIDNMQTNVKLRSTCPDLHHYYEIQSGTSLLGNANFFEAFYILFPNINDITKIPLYVSNISEITHNIDNSGIGTIIININDSIFNIECNLGHYSMNQYTRSKSLNYEHLHHDQKYNIEILLTNKNIINIDNYLYFKFSSELLIEMLNSKNIDSQLWIKIFELSLTEQYNNNTRIMIKIDTTDNIFTHIVNYINSNIWNIKNLHYKLGEYDYKCNDLNFLYSLPQLFNLNVNFNSNGNINLLPILENNVVSIGDRFLMYVNINNINLENLKNITKIGIAFMNFSQLSTIDLNQLSNIESFGDYFLSDTKLTEIDFRPLNKIQTIAGDFLSNTPLTRINFDNPNIEIIKHKFLFNTLINNLDFWPLRNIKIIGDNFMGKTKITHIDLSCLNQLEKIGNNFLINTPLTHIILSTSIKEVGTKFLHNTLIENIDLTPLSNITIINDSFLAHTRLSEIDLSQLTKIQSIGDLFLYKTPITKITFPDSLPLVHRINDYFLFNTQLTELNLDAFFNVIEIGNAFLCNNYELKKINLEPFINVNKIGSDFFINTELPEQNDFLLFNELELLSEN